MTATHTGNTRRQRSTRRLLALFLFGWLNLVLQPCFAGMAMGATDAVTTGHCARLPGAPETDPCISMLVRDCVQADDLQLDALPRSGDDHRLTAPTGFPPVEAPGSLQHSAMAQSRHLRPPSEPPLTIRYCTLRN